MRTQSENPIFKSHGDLIGPSGRYPPAHVNIFWNEREGGGAVSDLEIVFIPRGGFIPVTGGGLALWRGFSDYIARWNRDLGNACDGWLEPDGLTPAQIFGHLLRIGFASQDQLVAALREFSRIEGDAFAADMMSAFIDEEEVD